MRKHRTLWAALALILASSLAAQEAEDESSALAQAAEGEGIFFETVDVNLVNLEVYVTDRQGNPVLGLTEDDFEVFENKKPVKITNFFPVREGRPVVAPEPEAIEAQPLPVTDTLPDAVPEFEVPEDQRLYLVVYIDNFNIRPFNRNRVFIQLRQFLAEQLSDEDRVMLVSYDRSLHYRHPFTSDPEIIARSLFDLEGLSGHALSFDSDRRDILRAIAEAETLGEVEWRVRTFAESRYNDLSFTIDAMESLVEDLGGLPGRKAMLYVSDGLPTIVGEDLFHALQRRFDATSALSTAHDFNANRLFGRLAAKANTNRVTFYTIDAAGLRVPGGSSVEVATAEEAGLAQFVDSIYISNLQSSLLRLAEDTGGQAVINSNNVSKGLNRIARDFKTYYSIGYVPAHSGDGRYYKIEVKLKDKRKGVTVRHRNGYRDRPITERMSSSAMATLVYGYQDNPLDLAIRIADSRPDTQGNSDYQLVDIVVEIPIKSIELVNIGDYHVGQTKVYFAAMDEEGATSEVSEVPLNLRIPDAELETALTQLYPYRVTLRMRRGPHRLAVGLFDEVAANKSFLSRRFVVGS